MMALLELFWTFFKIGMFTFGGGLAMLRLAQEQVVAKGWLEENQIINFVDFRLVTIIVGIEIVC